MLSSLLRSDASLALAMDQYELTMAYAFWKNAMDQREAAFHMFFRKNPFDGGFVVSAGLGTLVELLENFRFSTADLDYLNTLTDRAGLPLFEGGFLDHLAKLRFSCDVAAVPEGTVVFPNAPLVRVQGPILQAQLIESLLLNTLNFQSLIATKAARMCIAAQGDPVVDFGLRRAQGMDGALSASRACYIGGCTGTSNVLAGKLLGIPVLGTHAHSWVMSFDDELDAFRAFAATMPNNCVFLVDTYGTLSGVRNAIAMGHELRASGHEMTGIRLDSGDLAYFSKTARAMLDEAGFENAAIMASNELDEYVIASLKRQGAAINVWGVGTKLITAHEDPALSGVYKLTAIRAAHHGPWSYKLKISEQKAKMSVPGLLQVHRFRDSMGKFMADAVATVDEDPNQIERIIDPNDNTNRKRLQRAVASEALLQPLLQGGQRVAELPNLDTIRARLVEQLDHLDESHLRFEYPHIYPVGLSPTLNQQRDEMITRERERLNEG
ncbi:MAG: nicotinate phosphoribosyltransferase [Candidatus Competibacterales bacterium]